MLQMRECCRFGRNCFRKTNSAHRLHQSHPGDDDYRMPSFDDPPTDVPACRFGEKCERRNRQHFREFSHPKVVVQEKCELGQLESTRRSDETKDLRQSERVRSELEDSTRHTVGQSEMLQSDSEATQESMRSEAVEESQDFHMKRKSRSLNEFNPLVDCSSLIRDLQLGIGQATIRTRVVIKSDKHTFNNYKGPGVMSTVDLIDVTGDEIRLTAFGPCVDRMFDSIEVGNVYFISKFKVNRAVSKPGLVIVNKLELNCTDATEFLLDNDGDELPHLNFNFEPLASMANKQKNDVADVIAVIESFGPLEDVALRNASAGKKRELNLVDESAKILLTIWGTNAEKFESIGTIGSVIAIKRARVFDYKGRSLDSSCLSSSTYKIDPTILEAFNLFAWYESTVHGF